jgi:rod shape-determining protein MreC
MALNDDLLTEKRLRQLRWALLGLFVLGGLATTGATRYRPSAVQRPWDRVHGVLSAVLIDPVRNRAHKTLTSLRRARDLWDADEENQRLRGELTRLETDIQLTREQNERLKRLSGLGQWGGPPEIVFLPADVVGSNTTDGALLTLNRGHADGIRPRDPVVSLGGLVGIVRSVAAHSAQVQSITDPLSGVGAIGVGTGDGARAGTGDRRTRGIVLGRGHDRSMEFHPENEVQPIEPGARLVSSGFKNSVFPKGLVIGIIEQRGHDPYGLPIGVVRPAVTIAQVEEVLVIVPASRAGGERASAPEFDDSENPAGGPFEIDMPIVDADFTDDAEATSPTMVFTDAPTTSGMPALTSATLTLETAIDARQTTAPAQAARPTSPTRTQ